MRWWLNTDHKRFCVDNAVVNGLDFSALPTDVWMIQWSDGKGEIERQVDTDTNDNGLRERIIDILPYCPYFQDFLAGVPYLTIPQAKKVQIDLINEVYNSKRQAPFHYPVAAGDYWWDATDDTLYSSTAAGLQNTIASLNSVIAALNSVVAHYNSNFVGIINQNAGYDNTLVSQINTLVAQINGTVVGGINGGVVDPHNNSVATDNSYGQQLIAYINSTVLSFYGTGGAADSVNYALRNAGGTILGLNADIAHTGISWANPYTATYVGGVGNVGPGTYNVASPAPFTSIPSVAVANAQWIPVGSTVPVNVTPAEQAAIMNGISARTNDLNIKRNIKIGEVNALTTLAAVIAYDVTTGW